MDIDSFGYLIISTVCGLYEINTGTGIITAISTEILPGGFATDSNSDILMIDPISLTVSRITLDGKWSTAAGSDLGGGDFIPALESSFDYPFRIATDSNDNFFVLDDKRIRAIRVSPE
jgi:hypothetical protein